MTEQPMSPKPHFKPADPFTRHVMNPIVAFLARRGINLAGAAVLGVRGRTSGEMRTTPVNPLTLDGGRYLVAPRGETQWVRNLRVSGEAQLTRGRKTETLTAVELGDDVKGPILRAYLEKWAWETGIFFDGVKADAPEDVIREIAPKHPIFEITPAS
jgi:deazaflavin-dependent oxidoreductase (nitroreductase family)